MKPMTSVTFLADLTIDCAQDGKNCYDSFNLLVRRDPKESNFRSVLETIREIMNTDTRGQSIPPWLNDIFLGYGNPISANYRFD